MYICRYCKAEHQEKVKFCTKCGMKMKYDDISDEKPIKSEKKEEKMKNNNEKDEKKKESIEKKQEVKEEKKENKETSSDASSDDKDEDPFVYKFDSGSDGSKKSGDGVWLAIVAIVVVIAIIIIGTSRKNAQEEANSNNNETSIIAEESSEEGDESNEDEGTEESGGEEKNEGDSEGEENESSEEESNEEPVEEVQEETPEPEQSGPSETASSTLIDTSALRFDYSPKQVKDQDFSTAWIEAERDAGINEYVMVNYGEEKEIDRLGIVPGYGRDAEIYNENNRVKRLTLEFSDGSTVEKDLEDKYAMHMLEFDRRKTSSVKVIINEVYSGSKYNDTAISEIDVDSDYVKNNDPEGALRFYEENKKESAKRPS